MAKSKAEEKAIADSKKKDSIAKIKEDQKIALELLRKRNDSVAKVREQEKIIAESKRKESILKAEAEQEMALELLRKRNDSVIQIREQEKVLEETKRKDSILRAEEEQEKALEKLRKRNEAFAKSNDKKNKEHQEKVVSQSKEAQNKNLIQRRQYDSILKVREQERKQLIDLRRQNDSIASIIDQERRTLEKLRNDNALAQENISSNADFKAEENKRLEMLERIKFRDSCHYQINEYDKFYNITTIRTETYTLSNNLTVELYRQGRKTNVFFNYNGDLGCASYLPNQRSSVKVTLENNQTITFYHSWDIECGTFLFKAILTTAQMNILNNSPIQSISLKGTEDSKEINFIDYKEFFIDKIKCLE